MGPPGNKLSENGRHVGIFRFSPSLRLAFRHVHVEISSRFGRGLGDVHRRVGRWTLRCKCDCRRLSRAGSLKVGVLDC